MNAAYRTQRTRVKICGFTRPDDAAEAARLGVDAIGLVFYEPSPRHVLPEQAIDIVAALPPFVSVVGLFVNASSTEIERVIERVRIDLIQFHGDESPDFCESLGQPYIKAVAVGAESNWQDQIARHSRARGFLLDAWHPDARGGTGHCFDWNLIPAALARTCILAGGLAPDNVGLALNAVQPYALDVSSGVESAKGIKDAAKMAAFLKEVHAFDYRTTI
jgi:phosphoribosylanthranilate isomerase